MGMQYNGSGGVLLEFTAGSNPVTDVPTSYQLPDNRQVAVAEIAVGSKKNS